MPRVHYGAVFCTAQSGDGIPYTRRPDSVRRVGDRCHRIASDSSLKPAAARREPFLVNSLLPELPTCPVWSSAAPALARCEPVPVFRLTPASCDSGSWPDTMKNELLKYKVFRNINEVVAAVVLAVGFYNNRRLHMSIGMKTPSEAAELTGDRDMRWTSYRHQAIKSALPLYLRKPAGEKVFSWQRKMVSWEVTAVTAGLRRRSSRRGGRRRLPLCGRRGSGRV